MKSFVLPKKRKCPNKEQWHKRGLFTCVTDTHIDSPKFVVDITPLSERDRQKLIITNCNPEFSALNRHKNSPIGGNLVFSS